MAFGSADGALYSRRVDCRIDWWRIQWVLDFNGGTAFARRDVSDAHYVSRAGASAARRQVYRSVPAVVQRPRTKSIVWSAAVGAGDFLCRVYPRARDFAVFGLWALCLCHRE